MPKLFKPRELPVPKRALSPTSWSILHEVDSILADVAHARSLPYKRVRTILNRVPRAERGVDWTERVVLLYGVHRMKASRCASLKKKIAAYHKSHGDHDKRKAFEAALKRVLDDKVLNGHGYSTSFKSMDRRKLALDLQKIFEALNAEGYTAVLNSGTLLGAVRDGDFIGHDDDVDLAVFVEGSSPKERIAAFSRLHDVVADTMPFATDLRFMKNSPSLQFHTESGLQVDLFAAWEKGGKVYVWPHTYGDLSRADVFPLGTQPIQGIPLPAPRNAEAMLAVNYGENWRVPDPDFSFSWSRARRRFARFVDEYERFLTTRKVRQILSLGKM
ncbi:LicD family protein [Lutimaribacter pacificus]|uniref:LicD family protein n=1 Tax=Lutimaribacter pacificus TaxID=391948 RepID=A0A1H0GC44_9RHOB|nr:LicD family protein [Lutimaribacter pacificus]SHJ86841.1 LicD family protein [Lutimaribacter pacificus]